VRKRLFEATLSSARYNPSIRSIYRRLKEAGKAEKVARIAAARKLLLIAHAIYKSGELFRDPWSRTRVPQELASCSASRAAVDHPIQHLTLLQSSRE